MEAIGIDDRIIVHPPARHLRPRFLRVFAGDTRLRRREAWQTLASRGPINWHRTVTMIAKTITKVTLSYKTNFYVMFWREKIKILTKGS